MDSALEEITEAEVINAFIDARLNELHKIAIGRVESYDAIKNTVTVTPMTNRMIPDDATPPNYVSEKLPALADVQVAHIRGNGMFVAVPLTKGDTGILLFCDRNHSQWRATGNQSDPGDLGLHTMSSALFVPAVFPDKSPIQNADANNLVIGSDSNHESRIVIKPSGEIDLGASATNFVAMADKVNTMFNTIINMLNSIFGAASTPILTSAVGTPDAVYAAMKTAVSALFTATTWPSTTGALASTNTKAED